MPFAAPAPCDAMHDRATAATTWEQVLGGGSDHNRDHAARGGSRSREWPAAGLTASGGGGTVTVTMTDTATAAAMVPSAVVQEVGSKRQPCMPS
jgi:hypothetical protein